MSLNGQGVDNNFRRDFSLTKGLFSRIYEPMDVTIRLQNWYSRFAIA